ncbi:MAG: MBL fold metallo-hydrolase [Micropruina sp.]|nr:MBL fold metallo-hydrolase [Micropruina sp.]
MSDQALVRLGSLSIRVLSVSTMQNNVYLITHTESGAQVLIDAAADAPAIGQLIEAGARDVTTDAPTRVGVIVTTHGHWDHVRALAEVKRITGARTCCGTDDASSIEVPMDFTLEDGDVGAFAGFELLAVGLRGHTPGSIALALEVAGHPVHLFTGDSLFPGGPGRTTNPDDFRSLMRDLEDRVFAKYPDDTLVLPGHGLPTTLGAERPQLSEWWARGW